MWAIWCVHIANIHEGCKHTYNIQILQSALCLVIRVLAKPIIHCCSCKDHSLLHAL